MQVDVRDTGLIPGLGRSPGGGYGNPLQYSCLENPMDRGAWQATVQRVAKCQIQLKWVSMPAHRRSSLRVNIWDYFKERRGFPGSSESFCNEVGKIPWRRKWQRTHSNILAWRIPWTEEPGGLQCMGSQRVRQDGASREERALEGMKCFFYIYK